MTPPVVPSAAIRPFEGLMVAWRRRRNFGGWHRAADLGAPRTVCGIEIPRGQLAKGIRVVYYGVQAAVPADACRRCFAEIPAATPDQSAPWLP